MKNFLKIILAATPFLFFASPSKAQITDKYPFPDRNNQRIYKPSPEGNMTDRKLKTQLGIDVLVGIPFSDFADGYGPGLGGNLKFEKPIFKDVLAGISLGYVGFKQKEFSELNLGEQLALIPVTVGTKVYLSTNFYVGLDAGAGIVVNGDANTRPLVAPSLGLVRPLQKNNSLGISFKLERTGDISYGGFLLSYSFGLTKG